jgi:hypothetical protein
VKWHEASTTFVWAFSLKHLCLETLAWELFA